MVQSGAENYFPADEEPTPAHKTKSTARWCKGRKGREHTPVLELDGKLAFWHDKPCSSTGFLRCKHQLVCSACGKILADGWEQVVIDQCPELHPAPRIPDWSAYGVKPEQPEG